MGKPIIVTHREPAVDDDDFVASLLAVKSTGHTNQLKLVELFRDRPKVLEAIKLMRTKNRLSYTQIARAITVKLPEGEAVSPSAVQAWLEREGIQ